MNRFDASLNDLQIWGCVTVRNISSQKRSVYLRPLRGIPRPLSQSDSSSNYGIQRNLDSGRANRILLLTKLTWSRSHIYERVFFMNLKPFQVYLYRNVFDFFGLWSFEFLWREFFIEERETFRVFCPSTNAYIPNTKNG